MFIYQKFSSSYKLKKFLIILIALLICLINPAFSRAKIIITRPVNLSSNQPLASTGKVSEQAKVLINKVIKNLFKFNYLPAGIFSVKNGAIRIIAYKNSSNLKPYDYFQIKLKGNHAQMGERINHYVGQGYIPFGIYYAKGLYVFFYKLKGKKYIKALLKKFSFNKNAKHFNRILRKKIRAMKRFRHQTIGLSVQADKKQAYILVCYNRKASKHKYFVKGYNILNFNKMKGEIKQLDSKGWTPVFVSVIPFKDSSFVWAGFFKSGK